MSKNPTNQPAGHAPALEKTDGKRKWQGKKKKAGTTAGADGMDRKRAGIPPERRCSSRTFRYGYLVTT